MFADYDSSILEILAGCIYVNCISLPKLSTASSLLGVSVEELQQELRMNGIPIVDGKYLTDEAVKFLCCLRYMNAYECCRSLEAALWDSVNNVWWNESNYSLDLALRQIQALAVCCLAAETYKISQDVPPCRMTFTFIMTNGFHIFSSEEDHMSFAYETKREHMINNIKKKRHEERRNNQSCYGQQFNA